MKKIVLDQYETVIFDFDGVILDSNKVKKNSIFNSVEGILNSEKRSTFVDYFVRFNGVPRREKIEKFVSANEVDLVLGRYEEQLQIELYRAKLMPGVKDYIQKVSTLSAVKKIYVLSGGEVDEIKLLLKYHSLDGYFDGVYAAPYRKEQNFEIISPNFPVLFFGDSLVDYRVALQMNLDFVFVYGATNVVNWKLEINKDQIVAAIENFTGEI